MRKLLAPDKMCAFGGRLVSFFSVHSTEDYILVFHYYSCTTELKLAKDKAIFVSVYSIMSRGCGFFIFLHCLFNLGSCICILVFLLVLCPGKECLAAVGSSPKLVWLTGPQALGFVTVCDAK